MFPSEQWTLEFDLAQQEGLATSVHQAVNLAQLADQTEEARAVAIKAATEQVEAWRTVSKSADEIAVLIFEPLTKRTVSKAQVAEQLAKLIEEMQDEPATFRSKIPPYLAAAIDHVTGREPIHETFLQKTTEAS